MFSDVNKTFNFSYKFMKIKNNFCSFFKNLLINSLKNDVFSYSIHCRDEMLDNQNFWYSIPI